MPMSFGTLELTERLKRENVLMKIDVLIAWEELRPKLTGLGLYRRELSHDGGQEPFDGLMMSKGATGTVIDATLIESAARPKKTIILEVDAKDKAVQYEDGSQPGISCTEEQSADPATWLKKDKKSQFGYRSYLAVDAQDGYVRGTHTAPANQSKMMHFEAAIDGAHIEANRVYADKGSASNANRQFLRKQKIKRAILHRAYNNKPLSARQKLANPLISKKRYIVEQCFGTIKCKERDLI